MLLGARKCPRIEFCDPPNTFPDPWDPFLQPQDHFQNKKKNRFFKNFKKKIDFSNFWTNFLCFLKFHVPTMQAYFSAVRGRRGLELDLK